MIKINKMKSTIKQMKIKLFSQITNPKITKSNKIRIIQMKINLSTPYPTKSTFKVLAA